MKYTEAILSNSTRKQWWFEIAKMLIAVREKKITVSFSIICSSHFRSLFSDSFEFIGAI